MCIVGEMQGSLLVGPLKDLGARTSGLDQQTECRQAD
jgi:hypothetical protein